MVCWRLLEREAAWLPPWRELLRVYHRLEARGEIRGGRFIAGLSGEQFALPEAIGAAAPVRQPAADGALVCVVRAPIRSTWSAPCSPATKVPRVAGSRVLYATACRWRRSVAGEVEILVPLDAVPGERGAQGAHAVYFSFRSSCLASAIASGSSSSA